MSPLLTFLSSWNGRRSIESEIARRGFTAHYYYQKEIRRYCCLKGIQCDIDTYWSEVAKEWVMSAGRAASDQRIFRGEAAYRSNYLDKLYRKLDSSAYPFRVPSLHPCLNERRMEDEKSHLEISRDLNKKINSHKEAEACELEDSNVEWAGTRSDINIILGEALKPLGFYKVSSKKWNEDVLPYGYQKLFGDLTVQCGILRGKYNFSSNSIDLRVRIFMNEEPNEIFRDGNFNNIIPGFGYYRGFMSKKACMVGINALAQCVDVFMRSFREL